MQTVVSCQNLADLSETITCINADADYPVSRLLDSAPSIKFRTNNVREAVNCIHGDFSRDWAGLFAAARNNFTQSAKWATGVFVNTDLMVDGDVTSGTYWTGATSVSGGYATVNTGDLDHLFGQTTATLDGAYLIRVNIQGFVNNSPSPKLRVGLSNSGFTAWKYAEIKPAVVADQYFYFLVDLDTADGDWDGTADAAYGAAAYLSIDATDDCEFEVWEARLYRCSQHNLESGLLPSVWPNMEAFQLGGLGLFSYDGAIPHDAFSTFFRLAYSLHETVAEVDENACWFVLIEDSANPDGYLEIGRLVVSAYWMPSRGPVLGQIDQAFIDFSKIQAGKGGGHQRRKAGSIQTLQFSLNSLRIYDTAGYWTRVRGGNVLTQDLVVIIWPDREIVGSDWFALYGRMDQSIKILFDGAGIYSMQLSFREKI